MRHRLSHDLTPYKLPGAFGFRIDAPDDNQSLIVSRLIDYYFYMKSEVERRNVTGIKGIWAHFSKLFAGFESILNSRNVSAVSEALLKVCTTPLVSGFASYHHFDSIYRDPRARMFESYLTIDRMLSLGEAIGAASPQTPYQTHWGYHDLDLNALLGNIKSRLPFDIRPPVAGGGAFGIKTSDGIISISDVLAMYVANRVNSVLSEAPEKTVCEIGGGTGTLAYYMSKTCAMEVTVADLPIVSIIQGYYLMKSLGPESVHLSGEASKSSKIKIIPYWELDGLPENSVSLFVNVDSMPEIDAAIARDYMRIIRKAGINSFLSINQESGASDQGVVQNLVDEAGGFRRAYRFPYWMISGYVEELYAVGS